MLGLANPKAIAQIPKIKPYGVGSQGNSRFRNLHANPPERWAAVLDTGSRDRIVPMSSSDVRAFLAELAEKLEAAVEGMDPADRVAELGAELADSHFAGDEVLGRSIAVLNAHLAAAGKAPSRVAELMNAFTTGYLRTFRDWLLDEQESVRAADIAARRKVEEQLRASEARLRAVFSQAGVGTGLSDMTGRIIEVNNAFASMLGYRPEEVFEMSVTDLTHPEDLPGMWDTYAALLRGQDDHVQQEKAYRHRDGHTVWTNINVSLIRDDYGQPQYTLMLVEDISDRRALRERLHYRAHHDQLTGLANRSRFFDVLAGALADPNARVGLCYVDLDHFKVVNDTFGHMVGDELLVQAAARLRACLTGPDQLVARMGGDEFVILLPHSGGAQKLRRLAAAVLRTFHRPFEIHNHRLSVSVSIGVMEEHVSRTNATELLQAADTTMYWAKTAGRDRYAMFDAARGRREHTRAELTAAMPVALSRGEFVVDYQPIVSLGDGRMVAVEALVRWQHPDLGILAPARFIDLAEDNGHIRTLGAHVLERACRCSRRWHDEYSDLTPIVSVNVSAVEVADPDWLQRVRQIIADTDVDPSWLQLELTERALMQTTGRPLRALHQLAETGVHIAIDDFGTGYSNLAYLSQLPLDVVKLAGPFIHHIRDDGTARRADMLILEAIIKLAHALRLSVTAEYVETRHQVEVLRDLGSDTAQGKYFYDPVSADKLASLLATAEPG
ncbi:cyclic Di-GMP phosphodiesterase RmdA [Nocardia iowensis]